jgi:hypothetical protein
MIEISQYLFFKLISLLNNVKYINLPYNNKISLMEEGKLPTNISIPIKPQ